MERNQPSRPNFTGCSEVVSRLFRVQEIGCSIHLTPTNLAMVAIAQVVEHKSVELVIRVQVSLVTPNQKCVDRLEGQAEGLSFTGEYALKRGTAG